LCAARAAYFEEEEVMRKGLNVLNTATRRILPLALGIIVMQSAHVAFAQEAASDSRLTVMSQEQLDGAPVGEGAASLHVQGGVRASAGSEAEGVYEELFGIDTGAADSIAPASELERIGVVPIGQTACVLADGSAGECAYGIASIEFMGEVQESRIVFGPEGVKPALGRSALEAVGFTVDSATQTLKRLAPSGDTGP
jgi:predicted aspartyl protease